MAVILITGGARSGKSAHAERAQLSGPAHLHRDGRGARCRNGGSHRQASSQGCRWIEREVPLDLLQALIETDGAGPRLVDCLTLWLSNIMHAGRDWEHELMKLAAFMGGQKSPVIFVTNEVGLGIVPDNALARSYRDAAGIMNQVIAAVSDEVEFVVAGLPMKLK